MVEAPSTLPRERVLVMGATGMLGHEVVNAFSDSYEVHATVRDPVAAQALGVRATLHPLEAFDMRPLRGLLAELAPRLIVNCVGVVKQLPEGSQSIPAITVNALFPHLVAASAEEVGARLLHVSTDCVFSGNLPLGRAYSEEDLPDARDLYGRTKLLGEVDAPALTLRTSIIGWELTRPNGLLGWFAAQRGANVTGYTRAIFSGLTTQALARILLDVAVGRPSLVGLYHVSSDPISKHDLLAMINERLELDVRITPVDDPVINRALDSSRFRADSQLEVPSWDRMLDAYLIRERGQRETHA